jgi:hypothetical protein
MLSECINDFFKKYKKYIFIICIIFAILILWKLSNTQENIDDTNSNNKNETTLGGFILYSFLVLVCGCLIPLIIMYYITRASARAAIKTTPCRSIITQGVINTEPAPNLG